MRSVAGPTPEHVVLLDSRGRAIGHALKSEVHSAQTPLHLAFSLYLFDRRGRLLLTRRSLGKRTWPGVWTNTCCGHPALGEDVADAARRRVGQELGVELESLRVVLPDFSYAARDASGVWENEICPVFVAPTTHPELALSPNADEVMDYAWVPWPAVRTAMAATPFAFSPWAVQQVALLAAVGDEFWAVV